MSNRKDTYKYHFKDGNKIVHSGITNNLKRRKEEHQSEYKPRNGRIEQVGETTTRRKARKWEKGKPKA